MRLAKYTFNLFALYVRCSYLLYNISCNILDIFCNSRFNFFIFVIVSLVCALRMRSSTKLNEQYISTERRQTAKNDIYTLSSLHSESAHITLLFTRREQVFVHRVGERTRYCERKNNHKTKRQTTTAALPYQPSNSK